MMDAVRKPRPVGVSILAVLQWIGAGFLVLYGVILTFAGPLFVATMRNDPNFSSGDQTMLDGMGPLLVGLGVFCLALAGLAAWLGWGVWVGKNWARVTQIVLASIGVGFTVLAMLGALFVSPLLALFYVVFLAWYGFLLWYWTRPGVKAYYEPAPPAPPPIVGPSW